MATALTEHVMPILKKLNSVFRHIRWGLSPTDIFRLSVTNVKIHVILIICFRCITAVQSVRQMPNVLILADVLKDIADMHIPAGHLLTDCAVSMMTVKRTQPAKRVSVLLNARHQLNAPVMKKLLRQALRKHASRVRQMLNARMCSMIWASV